MKVCAFCGVCCCCCCHTYVLEIFPTPVTAFSFSSWCLSRSQVSNFHEATLFNSSILWFVLQSFPASPLPHPVNQGPIRRQKHLGYVLLFFFFKQSLNRNVRYKWLLSNKLWWTTNGDSKSFLRDRWWLLPSKPMESEWGRKFQNGESSLPLGLRLRPSREGMAATGALSLLVARDYWRALGDIEKWQRTQTSPVSMTQQVRSQDKYLLVKTL